LSSLVNRIRLIIPENKPMAFQSGAARQKVIQIYEWIEMAMGAIPLFMLIISALTFTNL
jgi:hypothetical protein